MTRTTMGILFLLLLAQPSTVHAQAADEAGIPAEVANEARRLLAEARAHHEARRYALAAEGYMAMYEVLRGANHPRAPIALWNAGLALMEIPGRDREARATFQRFLDESTTLTDDAQVRDWRSSAVERIAELDTRIRADEPEPTDTDDGENPEPVASSASTTSPVGPVILGLGGLVAVTGAVIGGVVLVQDDSLAAMCMDGHCPEAARPLANDIERLALTAEALVISGAAVALTGLLLTLLLRHEAPAETANVTAACGPMGCQLTGRF